MWHCEISYGSIKVDDVTFDVTVGRIKNFVEVGELELMAFHGEGDFSLVRGQERTLIAERAGGLFLGGLFGLIYGSGFRIGIFLQQSGFTDHIFWVDFISQSQK